jgi:hypothetical protein
VYLADRSRASARIAPDSPDIQAMLCAFIADGGQGIADLFKGVVVGYSDVLMPALMGPNIRTLTW